MTLAKTSEGMENFGVTPDQRVDPLGNDVPQVGLLSGDHGVHGANLPALPGDGLHQIPESLHQIGVDVVRLLSYWVHKLIGLCSQVHPILKQ